jgi:deazaflavin-dependent oxidoreductase (nitroreductase family)
MLGRTFLEFTHAGRKSGQQYATVAMVLSYDEPCQEAVICAAWGPETDWVRNLRAGSMTTVNIARDSFTARHQFLSNDEAFAVAQAFRRRHPHRLHTMQRLLGWGDLNDDATLRKFVEGHPMVRFSPERIADSVNHEEVHGHAGFDLPRTR